MNKTVDFWGIGAQKSGTTWLFENLKALNGFDLPPIKEFHYFDRHPKYLSPSNLNLKKPVERFQNPRYAVRATRDYLKATFTADRKTARFYKKWHLSTYDDAWYASLFSAYPGVTGEITPSYSILEQEDIQHMYRISPHAKLILIVRNPIDRAWSSFRYSKRKDPNFSLNKTTYDEIISFIDSDEQELRSDYRRTISNYLSVFPKKQLMIGFYDEIVNDPETFLSDVVHFIVPEYGELNLTGARLNRAVNRSAAIPCPHDIQDYLKSKYHEQIKHLSDQFGGYFSKWLQKDYGETPTNEAKFRRRIIF